jgi:hypothetical protein
MRLRSRWEHSSMTASHSTTPTADKLKFELFDCCDNKLYSKSTTNPHQIKQVGFELHTTFSSANNFGLIAERLTLTCETQDTRCDVRHLTKLAVWIIIVSSTVYAALYVMCVLSVYSTLKFEPCYRVRTTSSTLFWNCKYQVFKINQVS